MRIFHPAPDIGDEEGFSPEKDIFNRADTGRGMTNLVIKVTDPMVIAVDGQWGSGKTTFLKMWAGELRKLGVPVIYFDAFAHDHFDDAFSAIADEIVALFEAKKKTSKPAVRKLIDRTARVGRALGRSALKIGAKAATLGALDAADLKGVADAVTGDIADEASKLAEDVVEAYLKQHREQRSAFDQFHAALAELPELLSPEKSKGSEAPKAKPLVFIVDELDRCRPHFALQVLERIKHFFSVPNVHFVLGVHLDQLRNSVVAAYGSGINAQVYLEKFIHLTVHLVDASEHAHERNVGKYIAQLTIQFGFKGKSAETFDDAASLVRNVAEMRGFSFRTIERILTNLVLVIQFTLDRQMRIPPILAGLCILKVTDPALFVKAKLGALQYTDVIAPLSLQAGYDEETRSFARFADSWWRHCLGKTTDAEFAREHGRYGVHDHKRVVPILANAMVDWWQDRPT